MRLRLCRSSCRDIMVAPHAPPDTRKKRTNVSWNDCSSDINRPVVHRVQKVNMNRQAAFTVAGTGQPKNSWPGSAPSRRCNAATAGHERAERLHEEIRPQSSTRFMTLTRSFCLHGHERRTTGRSAATE